MSPIYAPDPGSRPARAYNLETSDLLKMKLGSAFLQSVEESRRVTMELDRLRSLQNDWNSYGAEPPNEIAFDKAKLILSIAQTLRLPISRVVASAEGGIGVCFVRGNRYAHIEASNQGHLAIVAFAGQTTGRIDEIANAENLIGELEFIRDYIG
jgi:hypothetical protein